MITGISFDEAFVFDCLAILMVKYAKTGSPEVSESALRTSTELAIAIGPSFCKEIMVSPEFSRLVEVNNTLFDSLDRLKKEGEWVGAATEVDQLVYKRYLAKKALQEKFFPDKPLTERKIGYGEDKCTCYRSGYEGFPCPVHSGGV